MPGEPHDLLAWFSALGTQGRKDLAAAMIAAFQAQDPQFERCQALWQRGKTARLKARLPGRPAGTNDGLHFLVTGPDSRLLQNLLSRLARGEAEFVPGRLQFESEQGPVPGWIASLGMGTFFVCVLRGELFLSASILQGLNVPAGLEEGHAFPIKLPPAEGFVLLLFQGQLLIVGSFPGVRRTEIEAIRSGPLRLGLARSSSTLLMLCMQAPGLVDGWTDMPFSLCIEPPDNRRLTPPQADGKSALVLALADRTDGLTKAVRGIELDWRFDTALRTLLEEHAASCGGYSHARYAADLAAAHRRWPAPSDIEADMCARLTAGRC